MFLPADRSCATTPVGAEKALGVVRFQVGDVRELTGRDIAAAAARRHAPHLAYISGLGAASGGKLALVDVRGLMRDIERPIRARPS